jgi:tetratricopeptide (TPR) repeat protein
MGWLSDLFERRKGPAAAVLPPPLPAAATVFDDTLFTLDKPSWFGLFTRSPNGRWLISWRDGDPSAYTGGARTRGKGAYLLYDTAAKEVLVQGRLERPNNGHVADNGVFVLEDWLFTNDLAGTLHAFDANGQSLLKRTFSANLMTNAVSKNGRYAVCQTANSPSEDGSSLFLFDLASTTQLFAAPPGAGWTMDYSIDESRVEVIAHIRELGSFRYAANGDFLDQNALEEASLAKGDYSTIIQTAAAILHRSDVLPGRLQEALLAVQRARRSGADGDPGWKATALKVQGLTHEALGETAEAMTLYQRALDVNPKIGLKRRLAALQKAGR